LLYSGLDVRNDSGERARDRRKLSLCTSTDGGATWSAFTPLCPGPSAYSDLARLPDGTLLCLYECGDSSPYDRLRLARHNPK
jgi:sialidase-1